MCYCSQDKVLISQWKEELLEAFRASSQVLSGLNKKVVRVYGASIEPLAPPVPSASGGASASASPRIAASQQPPAPSPARSQSPAANNRARRQQLDVVDKSSLAQHSGFSAAANSTAPLLSHNASHS